MRSWRAWICSAWFCSCCIFVLYASSPSPLRVGTLFERGVSDIRRQGTSARRDDGADSHYEEHLLRCSYGYRPGRSAQDAVSARREGLMELLGYQVSHGGFSVCALDRAHHGLVQGQSAPTCERTTRCPVEEDERTLCLLRNHWQSERTRALLWGSSRGVVEVVDASLWGVSPAVWLAVDAP